MGNGDRDLIANAVRDHPGKRVFLVRRGVLDARIGQGDACVKRNRGKRVPFRSGPAQVDYFWRIELLARVVERENQRRPVARIIESDDRIQGCSRVDCHRAL